MVQEKISCTQRIVSDVNAKSEALLYRLFDLVLAWEPFLLELGEHQFAIETYLEPSTAVRDQIDVHLFLEGVQKRVRHTDGLRGVVSVHAENDLDVHCLYLSSLSFDGGMHLADDPNTPFLPVSTF